MTKKKMRKKLGQNIRRHTGLSLPVAMQAGKILFNNEGYSAVQAIMNHRMTEYVIHSIVCGDGCCRLGYELRGPRGSYEIPR